MKTYRIFMKIRNGIRNKIIPMDTGSIITASSKEKAIILYIEKNNLHTYQKKFYVAIQEVVNADSK